MKSNATGTQTRYEQGVSRVAKLTDRIGGGFGTSAQRNGGRSTAEFIG
jgi:hypothetical protein